MPSTITHAYFANDVYNKMSIPTKELLLDHKEMLKTSAQNTDVLFFYNIANLKKGKKVRKFGYYSQKNKTYKFFETLINYIKYNGYSNDGEVMAYLYGMLSHYILDSTIHPYIAYKTGEYNSKDKSTYKYNQLHGEMESYLDNYFISIRENITPWKFKCYNYCLNVTELNSNLKEVIDFTYKETFNLNNMSKYYIESIKQMKSFYRIFRYDPTCLKKGFYHIVDFIMPRSILRVVPLSYHINPKGKKEFLNLERKNWYNPTTKTDKHNESVIDLYNISLNKMVKIVNELNEYIYNDKKINLKKLIGNNNYLTGKDCDKERELKYFEF